MLLLKFKKYKFSFLKRKIMKSKELLHELIHSLTKSEKRYFSVFTSIHKESNNYVKLFNAIHAQKEYNENKLLELFKGEDFVRQFSVAKNYLMNLVLKSLGNHHQKAKKTIELNSYLTEIEVLYWKGLYKLSHKKINQAKKIALKYDMTNYLLLINYWDRRIEDYVTTEMLNEDVVKETQVYLDDYNQQMQMNFLIKEMQKVTRSTITTTSETSHPVLKIFNHTLLQIEENKIINFYTKVDYLFLKGVGNAILGDQKKEFEYKMKLLKLLEENPHQIKENPLRYSSALNNILLYYYFQGYPEEYPQYLSKLDDVELKFHHAKATFYDTKYNLEIGYYLHLRDKKRIRNSLDEMEKWYSSMSSVKSVQAKMICEYNMALSYFYLDENKQSLKWCSSCFSYFDMKAKKFRHDLAVSVLITQVFIYIDLGHFDLALRHIDMIISIAQKNNYGEVEMKIFSTLKKMIKAEKLLPGIDVIKELIDSKGNAFINLDKDVVVFWLEKNGY
jgi:hypothetical protein